MSIFLNKDSKVIVQGITGGEGTKHTALMLKAGTQVVGGVNARKAGTTVTHGDVTLPVFGTVAEAITETGADVSIMFVPPAFAKDAVVEAVEAGIPLVVVITEGIPAQDAAEFWALAKSKGGATRIIGPNCPGIITPGESLVGITPANITGAGPIGLVSKSGTLTYQMMFELRDLGFSTAIGIGVAADRGVRGRPRHQGDRHDRRDRRRRRRARRRLHQGPRDEAGRRLRRRLHRS
jgi:succinyl-CoA synthetase alpha subunit